MFRVLAVRGRTYPTAGFTVVCCAATTGVFALSSAADVPAIPKTPISANTQASSNLDNIDNDPRVAPFDAPLPPFARTPAADVDVRANGTPDEYMARVSRARELIAEGDPRHPVVLYEPDQRNILYAGDFDPLARAGQIAQECLEPLDDEARTLGEAGVHDHEQGSVRPLHGGRTVPLRRDEQQRRRHQSLRRSGRGRQPRPAGM